MDIFLGHSWLPVANPSEGESCEFLEGCTAAVQYFPGKMAHIYSSDDGYAGTGRFSIFVKYFLCLSPFQIYKSDLARHQASGHLLLMYCM